MLRLSVGLFLALAFTVAEAGLNTKVITLTKDNFDEEALEVDLILVKFYAPWCGHCKAMAPAYEEVSHRLLEVDPPIPVGKVDATQDPELAEKYGVRGYPTLKIFKKGQVSDYTGGREAPDMINAMLKEAGIDTPIKEIHGATLMAKLCRDQTCNDAQYPIIDYDEFEGACHCMAHPCWEDDSYDKAQKMIHSCGAEGYPYLHYSYSKEGKLECGCRAQPHYNSPYILKVKCPGHHCDGDEHPILDFDEMSGECVCRSHPCNDVEGVTHQCNDPKFPILKYREEKKPDGGIKQICECTMGFKHHAAIELHEEF